MSDYVNRSLRAVLISSAFAGLIAGCGGGGGGGGGGGATPPSAPAPAPAPVTPTLTFSAPVVTGSVQAGQSMALSTNATVVNPADFANATTVFTYVTDTTGVILPAVQITQTSATTYRAVLQTAPTLAEGKYTGAFTVQVCRDSACAQQYPGSPMKLPYEITILPGAVLPMTASPLGTLQTTQFAIGTNPAPVDVNVQAPGRTWTARSGSPWIKLSNPAGTGSGIFRVSYDLVGLAVGIHSGDIVVTGSDGQTVTLPVRLQLLASSFSIDRGEIYLNAINGAPIDGEQIKFNLLDGVTTWSARADQPWLSVTPTGGPTPGIATLKADPSVGKLASGAHIGSLTISAPNTTSRNVPVRLNLTPATLSSSAATLTLGGPLGRDTDQATLTMNLNTMNNAHPWTLSALPAWLRASAASGTVKQDGTSITFSQNMAQVPYGTSTAALTATAQVNGDTLSVPLTITVNRDQHKLLFSEVGVGLSSTPAGARLSRTITVKDNFGQAPNWTASADQSWLSVARSGNTLTLSADAAALPVDTVSYATVSLRSTDSAIVTTEPLRVALWKSSTTLRAITKLKKTYLHLKADPIRPFLYANNGATAIDVYNFHTGALVGTIADLGAALGQMAISPNGDRLYTYDTTNRNIIVVDLRSMAKTASWPMASSVDHSTGLVAIRPNGVDVLIAGDGNAYLASNGRIVGQPRISGAGMTASRDGTRVYAIDNGNSGTYGGSYNVDYSALAGGALFSTNLGYTPWAGSNAQDVAVSNDGTRIFSASGSPYKCSSSSATELTSIGLLPGGDAYPNNVEVASDGRIYCGIAGYYSESDVWVHSTTGALLASFKFAGYAEIVVPRSMTVSADGLIMAAQTSDPLLVFVPVGP